MNLKPYYTQSRQKEYVKALSTIISITGKRMISLACFYFICLLTLTSVLPQPLMAGTYYVSKLGNDTNPGTEAQPWLTIQKAANSMTAGDTAYIQPGTYDEFVVSKTSGTTDKFISFVGSSGPPVIGGFNISHSYLVIDGFSVNGANSTTGSAISFQLTASNCILRNCTFENLPAGRNQVVLAHGDWSNRPVNITIENNQLLGSDNCGMALQGTGHKVTNNYLTAPSTTKDAVYIHSSNTLFSGNRIINWSRASGSSEHVDLIQAFSTNGEIAQNNIIEKNLFANCTGTQMGHFEDQAKTGNIAFWSWRNNIWANVEAIMNIYTPNFSFYNNVFYKSGTNSGAPLLFRSSTDRGVAHYGKVFNNIFMQCGSNPADSALGWYATYVSPGAAPLEGFESDYNLVLGTGEGTTKIGFSEPHGINGLDPFFVNTDNLNFMVAGNSPAISKGKNLYALFTQDFLGVSRSSSGAWDLGAITFNSTLSPSPPAKLRIVQ